MEGIEIALDSVLSVVPKTAGLKNNPRDESCLVIFFSDGNREVKAKAFIREMEHEAVSQPVLPLLLFHPTTTIPLDYSLRSECLSSQSITIMNMIIIILSYLMIILFSPK